MTRDELARKLIDGEYGLFFYYPQHADTIARVWGDAESRPMLEELVNDDDAPGKARFIAAEILFARDVLFLERSGRERVADIYAEALRRQYTPHTNAWGLLWENDEAGEAGNRFLILGDRAVPALRALLDDTSILAHYEGSEEATLGNRAQYRVKDFAAYYLGRILRHPIPFHRQPAARDAEIEKLRGSESGETTA
jgi:hypothetical protein